jgi:5-methylcytosine-specific restriction protein A
VGLFVCPERRKKYLMPYKPKKPCAHPGCPSLTSNRYCETHAKLEVKLYDKYRRNPVSKKYYGGAAWRKIRAAFLAANPLCEVCQGEGRLTPATLAHHKSKLTDGGNNDWNNLQALCTECHSRLHAKVGDYF